MTNYTLEAYKSNRWLIRNISTGAIVAYPGVKLSQVAASWPHCEIVTLGLDATSGCG